MNILKYRNYEGTAELDMERAVCRGKILFIDDLVTYEAQSPVQLQAEFEAAVDDYLSTCAELGRQAQKALSGTFNVRVAPQLHRAMKLRAIAEGISLNEAVSCAFECYLNGRSEVTNHHTYIVTEDSQTGTFTAAISSDARPPGVQSVLQ